MCNTLSRLCVSVEAQLLKLVAQIHEHFVYGDEDYKYVFVSGMLVLLFYIYIYIYIYA
jgi:hypothetical protein